jgi:hypothetical protein
MNTLTATLTSILVAALLLTPVLDANAKKPKKPKDPKPGKSLMLDYDQDVTPDVIFGSGNANGFFTTGQKNDVEVGLRAKRRFPPENPTGAHSNADGTYSFLAGNACGETLPGWWIPPIHPVPKSVSFTSPSLVIIIFLGETSR